MNCCFNQTQLLSDSCQEEWFAAGAFVSYGAEHEHRGCHRFDPLIQRHALKTTRWLLRTTRLLKADDYVNIEKSQARDRTPKEATNEADTREGSENDD